MGQLQELRLEWRRVGCECADMPAAGYRVSLEVLREVHHDGKPSLRCKDSRAKIDSVNHQRPSGEDERLGGLLRVAASSNKRIRSWQARSSLNL